MNSQIDGLVVIVILWPVRIPYTICVWFFPLWVNLKSILHCTLVDNNYDLKVRKTIEIPNIHIDTLRHAWKEMDYHLDYLKQKITKTH